MIDFGYARWFTNPDAARAFLWRPDDLPKLTGPDLLDLHPGHLVADIGCGWGYLGHLLLPSVQEGGSITGFDLERRLIDLGNKRAKEAGHSASIRFVEADCEALPVEDASFDRAVCQTVLQHQSRPATVLAEMRRIVSPAGRVAAIEPDLLETVADRRDCVDESLAEHRALRLQVQQTIHLGVHRSGAGDYRIGKKLGEMMGSVGLKRITRWRNPQVHRCTPPYSEADRRYLRVLASQFDPDAFDSEGAHWRPLYEAGGGDVDLWNRVRTKEAELNKSRLEHISQGTYRLLAPSALYVTVGTVPDYGEPEQGRNMQECSGT